MESYYSYMLLDAGMTSKEQAIQRKRPTVSVEATAAVVLEQFSTRLPPDVLARLRVAAPQLGLRQSDITATAIDRFLRRRGF
jgi:hypothetical protein